MTWPITADDVRSALGLQQDQGDQDTLEELAEVACRRVDGLTGRLAIIGGDPTLYVDLDGNVPPELVRAAKTLAKVWWQQEQNGSRQAPTEPGTQADPGIGLQGIGLPRRVVAMLTDYLALPGIA